MLFDRYDTFSAHGCCDAQGCERLLELFGASFLLRTTTNPFGIPMPGTQYVMNGFMLAVCGSEREQRTEDIAGAFWVHFITPPHLPLTKTTA